MERTKNLPTNQETVDEMLGLARATPADRLAPELRRYARERLGADYPSDQLYVDLMDAYDQISDQDDEEREDAFLDAMDFLTGWCAPAAGFTKPRPHSYAPVGQGKRQGMRSPPGIIGRS